MVYAVAAHLDYVKSNWGILSDLLGWKAMPFALDDLDSNYCRVSTIPKNPGSFRTLVSMVEDITPESARS